MVEKDKLDKAIALSDFNIKKICEKTGITPQMLFYYRKGTYFPNVLIAVKLCKVLNEGKAPMNHIRVEDLWHD